MDEVQAQPYARRTRVLLVDDQPTVREGLKMRLALEPNLVIVGEAGGGVEAVRLAKDLLPDVVLMDVRMPGEDGVSITKTLRETTPHSTVVILSLYDDSHTRSRAREAGAAAFVAKHRAEDTLLPTLLRVARETDGGSTP
jgi:DNA-binding NarL/FixJ family response regulator